MNLLAQQGIMMSGTASSTDPYFAYVQSLMHFESSFSDQKGLVWTPGDANATITTASPIVGIGSGSLQSSYIRTPDSSAFNFGTGDFCLEMSIRFRSLPSSGVYCLMSRYAGSSSGFSWQFRNDSGGARIQVNMTGDTGNYQWAWSPATNTRYDLALARVGGQIRLFVGGMQAGSTMSSSDNVNSLGSYLLLGALYTGSFIQLADIVIDEWRMTIGQGRYSANYTLAFPFPDS